MHSAHRIPTSPREKGFALVMVLWAMLLLSVLGIGLLLEARAARAIANTAALQLSGRMLADGAINRVIMSLLNPRDPLRPPLDGSPQQIEFLGAQVRLSCESEAGKIDLNSAARPLLASLFRAQRLSEEETEFITKQIELWRSPIRNASGDDAVNSYRSADRPYGPRFGLFRSTGELRLVLGMTDALQKAVAPFITVWSTSGSVDLGVASEGLLRLLAADSNNLASTQLGARQNGNAAGKNRPVALGEVVTIHASSEIMGVTTKRTAAIQIAGDRNEPYRVLGWQ